MSDVFDANRLRHVLEAPVLYPAQRVCAQEMLTHFRGSETRHILFRAPLQSGKTGTYQHTIRSMLAMKLIDRAYILCGSHERELFEQVEADVKAWQGDEALNRTVHVLFRQHFTKGAMDTYRALIVVDESHMDCQFGQQLDRFLSRHRLSMAGTTPFMVQNQIFMISVSATPFAELSVLAHGDSYPKAMVCLHPGHTYYGPGDYKQDGLLLETYSVASNEGRQQFVQEIQRVVGRRKYAIIRLCEGRVAGDKQRRESAFERLGAEAELRYSAKDNEVILDILNEMAEENQVRLLRFNSKHTGARQQVTITRQEQEAYIAMATKQNWPHHEIPCLEDPPEVPTVVLLDGRLRCGKRVPKKHIGMTWDTSAYSNTDVILQGLVGRMCGYRGEGVYSVPMERDDRPILYTSSVLHSKNKKATLSLSDLERFEDREALGVVPRFATHLVRAEIEKILTNAHGRTVYPCVPIRFFLPDHIVPMLPNMSDRDLRQVCFDTFMTELDFNVRENIDLTDGQKEEIITSLNHMEGADASIRRLQGTSQTSFYRLIIDAIKNHTSIEKDHISDLPFITFCTIFEGYEGVTQTHSGDQAGTVYACIYTEVERFPYTIPLPSRIPRHNGITHFIRRVIDEPVVAVEPEAVEPVEEKKEPVAEALATYGFTPDIQDSPEALSQQLSHFIEFARSGLGYYSRIFKEVHGREGPRGIRLSVEAYGENLHVLRILISRLEAKYNVRITYKQRPQMVPTQKMLYHIGWEDAI